MVSRQSRRTAVTVFQPVQPKDLEKLWNGEYKQTEEELFVELPQDYREPWETDSECEEVTNHRKRKSAKPRRTAKKQQEIGPEQTNFVIDSTRSVLLQNIKRTISGSAPLHVDMPLELFQKTFNTATCNKFHPMRKLPNCVDGTALKMSKEQFKKLYGIDTCEYKVERDGVTVAVDFPLTFYLSYQNKNGRYHSRFKWYSIPLICRDSKNNILPTYNYRSINKAKLKVRRFRSKHKL